MRSAQGLSPRVRGSRRHRLIGSRLKGPIPACAGEPAATPLSESGRRAYPRVCGGAVETEHNPAHGLGLSPRVRGSLRSGMLLGGERGPIPACAGEP